LQRLRISVCNYEIAARKVFFDHVIHSVAAGPTDAKDSDTGFQIVVPGHREVQCHGSVRLISLTRISQVFFCLLPPMVTRTNPCVTKKTQNSHEIWGSTRLDLRDLAD
jgi:hypothetical protein